MQTKDNYVIQAMINNLFIQCESYKDEIALITSMYNSTAKALEVLCNETGMHSTVKPMRGA